MSWVMTLKKSMAKPWTTSLPAKDESQWSNLIQFHMLTFDKGEANTLKEDNEFIKGIKSEEYSTKGISNTIEVLEGWKSNPKNYRQMNSLKALVGHIGDSKVTSHSEMLKVVELLVTEVLPELKKKRAKTAREKGKKGQFKPKQIKEGEKTYQFNKPEDVKAYFNDKNYFNSSEEEQKVIIITVNEGITKDRALKTNLVLKDWAYKNKIYKLINKLSKENKLNSKSPIVRLFGVKLEVPSKREETPQIEGRTQPEVLNSQIKKYKNYKVVTPFKSEQAKIYLKDILTEKNNKFFNPFKRITIDELKSSDLHNLLSPEYDNLGDEMWVKLIDKTKEAVLKNEDAVINFAIKQIKEGRGSRQGLNLPTDFADLSDEEIRVLLTTNPSGSTVGLGVDFEKYKDKLRGSVSMLLEPSDKTFIDSLEDKLDKLWEELGDEEYEGEYNNLQDRLGNLQKLTYREKDGDFFFNSKTDKEKFHDFKEEANDLKDDLQQDITEQGEFKWVNAIFVKEGNLFIEGKEVEVGYNLEGFDEPEKELAKLIYDSLKEKKDLEDAIEISGVNSKYDLGDILNLMLNLGSADDFKIKTNFPNLIKGFTHEDVKNLSSKGEPYMFKEIKELMQGLKTDVPELRSQLINSIKEHIEKVLESPTGYIESEAKLIGKEKKVYSGKRITDEKEYKKLKEIGQNPKWVRSSSDRKYSTTLDILAIKGLIKE